MVLARVKAAGAGAGARAGMVVEIVVVGDIEGTDIARAKRSAMGE